MWYNGFETVINMFCERVKNTQFIFKSSWHLIRYFCSGLHKLTIFSANVQDIGCIFYFNCI